MAGDVHDVVDAAQHPQVAVGVLLGAVAGEVEAELLEAGPVGLLEPLVVAPDGAQHRGPRLGEDEVAARAVGHRVALLVDDFGADTGEGVHRRAGLAGGHAGQGADHDRAGLGLPPGVDDGGAVATDDVAVPDVGLGVDGLTDRAEDAQRGQVAGVGDLAALLHERADRGGRGVEERDAVLLDDVPPSATLGGVGGALVEHLRDAVGQRAVDDVGVAGDPADVGGAPVDVVVLEVEDRPVGVRGADEVAAGGVQDALGLAGGAGGVHDVERVLGVEGLGGVGGRGALDGVVPPHVHRVVPGDVLAGTPDHEHLLHGVAQAGGLLARLVDGRLERGRRTAAVAAVGGDHDLGLAVLEARGQRVGGEPAEDHGVRGADAGAGQHRDHGLGDHRHVDRDPVAGGDTHVGQCVGGLGDQVLQLGVGDGTGVTDGLADEVDGDLVAAAGLDVAVHAVVGRVQRAADVPLRERRVGPVEDLGERLGPGQALRLLGPEALAVLRGGVVGVGGEVGVLREVRGRLEAAVLLEQVRQGLVVLLAHCVSPARRGGWDRVVGQGHGGGSWGRWWPPSH